MQPIILNAFIIFATILLFSLSVWFFRRSLKRYSHELNAKKRCFEEIYESRNVPIVNLSEQSQTLAHDVCAIKYEGTKSYVSFSSGRMEILRHPSQIVNEFSISSFNSVPAILTVIGILGTFIGITVGLKDLDMSSDNEVLIDQAKQLIGGLGTAFWTSIFGMGSSFIFMIIMSWSVSKAKQNKNYFINDIQALCSVVTSNDLLHQLVVGQRQVSNQNDNLSNLVNVLTKLADKPSAMSSEEFEIFSKQHLSTVCEKIAGVEQALVTNLRHMKIDEALLSKNIATDVHAALNNFLTTSVSIMDEINQESKQSNQALFSLVGLLENSVQSKMPALTKDDIEILLNEAITKPIVQTSNEVTNLIKSFDCSMELLLSNMLTEKKLDTALSKSASGVTYITESMNALLSKTISKADLHSTLVQLVKTPVEQIHIDLNTNSNTAISSIDGVINAIHSLAKVRAAEFEELIDKMGKEIVEPIVNELSETNQVVADFAEVSNQLNQSVSKTVEEMAKATATVENFELHTLAKLNDFAHSMDDSLNNFAINSTTALNSITKEISGIVELGNASIAEQTKSFSKMVADSELIYKQQSQSLIDVGKNSAQLMSSARQELEQGLGHIDSKVINMSLVIQQELETFRIVYQENLTDYFNKQNTILDESLNSQRDGLNEVVCNFKHVFEDEYKKRNSLINDLNIHHKQMIDIIERIQSMAKALGLENTSWVDTLQQQSQSVGRQMAQLGLAFSSASEEFKVLTSQMRPEMDDYFKRANKSVSEYFSSFDATSSRIYSRLDSAVDLMIMVIQEAKQEKENLLNLKVKEKVS